MATMLLRLFLLFFSFPCVLSLGINCRGSAFCQYEPSILAPDVLSIFYALATGTTGICSSPPFNCGPINNTDIYAPGAHILCLPQGKAFLGGLCAFTQGKVSAGGTTGAVIKRKLGDLKGHGCRLCGSVPLAGDNDPDAEGMLTVNYVERLKGECVGVCPPTHYWDARNGTGMAADIGNGSWAENATATA